MNLTPLEWKVLISVFAVLLSVIGFFLVRLVLSIDSIAKDLTEIKVSVREGTVRHDGFERELSFQAQEIKLIKEKIFA